MAAIAARPEPQLQPGDESGTAPGDRSFRPDVQGLRAIAVLLVVFFHSGINVFSGGFVGVDVFFVISGFVITGVLLRERGETGRPSILAFYGRRSRRIIPAATLVIIVTVVASYYFLGIGGGIPTASDGRWAAVFLANFHFIATSTNYLSSTQPPSPLQNFWSLAVEEQFYLVYPTLFLLIASVKLLSFRVRMVIGLVLIVVASLSYSIVDTATNPTSAFFSPFTRAWELALGALIAIATPWLLRVPERLAAGATWLGLGAIAFAALFYTSQSVYPGSLVIVPVVGSALIIAGGMKGHTFGVEALLRLPPFQWFGKISYSLYLWHWPILIIAAEYAGQPTLSVKDNLAWVLLALAVSVVTYRLIENPIRHARPLLRSRWASVGLGVGLIAVTLGSIAVESHLAIGSDSVRAATRPASPLEEGSYVSLETVLKAVAVSSHIKELPSNLAPPLAEILAHPGAYLGHPDRACQPGTSQSTVTSCAFGDPQSKRTMVLYGDSHAGMWFQAIDAIAIRSHWKLVILYKDGCPASLVSVPTLGNNSGDWTACDQWHKFVVSRIKRIHPTVLIVSQTAKYRMPDGVLYTKRQWQRSVTQLLNEAATSETVKVVIGNLTAPQSSGPVCLARHVDDVQACSAAPNHVYSVFNSAAKLGAKAAGGRYIDVTPWFCSRTCSSVIGNDAIYLDNDHVSVNYTLFLEGVLAKALNLPH